MRSIFISIMTFLMMTACTTAPEVNIGIVPAPVSVSVKEHGRFALGDNITVKAASEDLLAPAAVFAEQAGRILGYVPEVMSGKSGRNAICVSVDPSLEKEEYRLKVTRSGITVRGGSGQGVFHGLQSLRQVLVECKDAGALPLMTVEDRPFFGYRGMMLDVCRHFSTVDEVKEFIDILSMHKVNTFHWHLTDDQGWRLEIKKYPQLTEIGSVRKETLVGHSRTSKTYDNTPYGKGCWFSHDQVREIIDYAAARGIEVIPEIDLPGHMQAALVAYPELGCTGGPYEVWCRWGISKDVLCAGKESTMKFLEDVLSEVADLFPSRYIHIGGDECPKVRWENCPVCQAKIKELGLKDDDEHTAEQYLQSYVMRRMSDFLGTKGKRIIGWDEILEGNVAPDATIMSWRGTKGGEAAVKLGHDVIFAPNSYCYFDSYQVKDTENEPLAIGRYVPVEKVYSFEPTTKDMTDEEKSHILGVQANMWTEYIVTNEYLEYMLLPRLSALSEVQWCEPDNRDYSRFLEEMDSMTDIYDILGYNYARHIFTGEK